jgi:homocitrate synthase
MQNPAAYEVLDPRDFGVERHIQIAHRLTGWNAVKQRCIQLGLTSLSDEQIKEATSYIKNLADTRDVSTEDLDNKLREFASRQLQRPDMPAAPKRVLQQARM